MTAPGLPPVVDLPPMAAPVVVVGDVHLSPREPEVATRFRLLLDRVEGGATLVLLGDLFDWWAGRGQARRPFERGVLDGLRAAADRGVRLAFVAGNRDFAFRGASGLPLEIWPEVVRTQWGERTVVLSHGDLLCTADVRYHRLRRVLRSGAARRFVGAVPFALTARVARGLRRATTADLGRKSAREVGLDYAAARRWLEQYGADALVVGHVHTGVHHRLPGSPPRDVYVLKDWHGTANAVTFDGTSIRLHAE